MPSEMLVCPRPRPVDDAPLRGWLSVVALLALLMPAVAPGQVTPVIGRGATAFDPEISVVNSGEVLDAQAVVSSDLRYVTITTTAQSSRLIALRPFPVQAVSGSGLVGGVGNNAPGGASKGGAASTGGRSGAGDATGGSNFAPAAFGIHLSPKPDELKDRSLLDRPGIIRLSASPGSPVGR